ncbi:alpha-L-glutamate ligase, RimK family [Ignisphaera aggregans DSM 17230]|uniref:Alpha-L-glutamate ligase, RimK family n=1 Tax=Ignisphaera aggregans (strain DSM 17230 / JCM 13409 / AQ1.S1) TaxID=583356 RepID=E0SQ58_IGNAA|nr:alpha-L-glutamate ligase, RimK family [Ignisphaera aggregans DSM 17230]
MAKVAVVADRFVPPWSARQILLALDSLGVSSIYLRPCDIMSLIDRGNSSVVYTNSLKPIDFDAVILRDLGVAVTLEMFLRRINVFKHIEMMNKPVVNPVDSIVTARDKYLSLLLLERAGIRVPKTVVLEDYFTATKIANEWKNVVVKPMIGSMGFGIIKAETPEIVYTIAKTLTQLRQPIYVQEFVEKPGRDIRLLAIGDEIVAAYYRVQNNPNEWKTNIAQGAHAEPIARIDSELEDIAFKTLRTLRLHYAGIDVAETKDGYIVFEVNASPQWRGIQRVTNINPALKLAKYVVSMIRR